MTANLWLGSQQSYETLAEAKLNVLAKYGDKMDSPAPFTLLSVQNGVGIIDIKGSLVNGSAGWLSYFGVTGYSDIREALVAAIQNPDVSSILLNIDSGGGAVAGVHETAQLISRVNKVKPVVSYNGGTEASAALWLGSSARTAYVAETALTGSLGVLMIHAERSKQLEDDGIKVTVIRAGTEKALANPYEALTPGAKKALEEKAQAMYDIFLGHVAAERGMSNTTADTKFGQGREFVGKAAVDVGLVDAVGSLEDAFTKAASLGAKIANKGMAKPGFVRQTASNLSGITASLPQVSTVYLEAVASMGDNVASIEGTSMPNPLTQEQLIAMAAGVTLDATTAESTTTTGAAPAVPPVEAKPEAAAPSELTAYLQGQVATLQAEVMESRMAAKLATDTMLAAAANLEALTGIARASIKSMTVALGGRAEAIDAMATADVVTEHARIVPLFKDKFKVGAVAATNTLEDKPVVKATVNPLFAYAAKSLSN